jgi:hypothetical protein
MSRDRERVSVEVTFERYGRLVDREHCELLNETVRSTMRLISFLSLTRYRPVHADDIALLTGLAPAFVDECLATLQFDGFVRETDLGFQSELEVEPLTWRSHKSLDQALRDMGQQAVSVRGRSGSWREAYYWPAAGSFIYLHFANLQDGEAA